MKTGEDELKIDAISLGRRHGLSDEAIEAIYGLLCGAVLTERERCARIAEGSDTGEQSDVGAGMEIACERIAAEIRRG